MGRGQRATRRARDMIIVCGRGEGRRIRLDIEEKRATDVTASAGGKGEAMRNNLSIVLLDHHVVLRHPSTPSFPPPVCFHF
jgi:hypothetical protein